MLHLLLFSHTSSGQIFQLYILIHGLSISPKKVFFSFLFFFFKQITLCVLRCVRSWWSLKLLSYNDPLHWAVGSYCELRINSSDTSMPFSLPQISSSLLSVTQSSEEKTFCSDCNTGFTAERLCTVWGLVKAYLCVSVCPYINPIHGWWHDIIFLSLL